MKFNKVIAIIAMVSMAVPAHAQDGLLRRVAQNDVNAETAGESQTKQGVIINNTNTTVQAAPIQVQQAPAPTVQPATVVEAAPVTESRAEQLRKARQGAEVATEQKIVEKLEEERLKEEQARAERLFGTKLDAAQAKALEEAAANMNSGKLAPTPVAPAPAQVTIEKVEIIQPAPIAPVAPPEVKSITVEEKEVVAPAVVAPAAPAAVSKMEVEPAEEEAPVKESQLYVSGSLGGVTYDASNVKGNFGGGFAIGTLVKERVAVEASFLYSNHYIDTFWNPGIFRELDQYDIGVRAKYYILPTRLKPYIGAGASYIIRSYNQRIVTSNGFQTQTVAGPSEDQTESINLDLLAGADFQVNEMISVGAGLGYSTNLMNRNEFDFNNYYATLPENTKALEEIDFWTVKATATLSF